MKFTLEKKALLSAISLGDFVQHYIIARLSEYTKTFPFIFIGGTMLRVCVFKNYRHSEDLDFNVTQEYAEMLFNYILSIVDEINSHPDIVSYIYEADDGKTMIAVSHADIGNADVKLDINIIPENSNTQTHELTILNKYKTIKTDNTIVCHTLDQVVSDKFNCLCARYKGRDIFDMHYLLNTLGSLKEGYIMYSEKEHTLFGGRFTDIAELPDHLLEKEDKFFEEWKSDQMNGYIPDGYGFYDAMDDIREEIKYLNQEFSI